MILVLDNNHRSYQELREVLQQFWYAPWMQCTRWKQEETFSLYKTASKDTAEYLASSYDKQ